MMQQNHQEHNFHMVNFVNNCLSDLKVLTNLLKPLSKTSTQINNAMINKLLLANDQDSLSIIKDILQHLLHSAQLKGLNIIIIGILTKIIAFVKIIDQHQNKNQEKLFSALIYQQQMTAIFFNLIDIIFVLKNKYKDPEFILRIIQTTFSLIDIKLIKFANQNAFTRLYSICFDCSLTNSIIQNISTSALFALTQVIFINDSTSDSLSILIYFLQFLFNNKKYSWIKDGQFKGIVWDLVIIAIKNYPIQKIEQIHHNKTLMALINHMYKTCIQKIFNPQANKTTSHHKKTNNKQNDKTTSFKKDNISDFIRFYKCYIYLSLQFSIKISSFYKEIIPFRQNLHLFKIFNQYERGTNLYIIVQGITILLTQGNFLLIQDDKFIILLDVFSKIIQELCLNNSHVDLYSQNKDFYLEKICGDYPKIIDSDFAKIMKNTIIKLRKNFQFFLQNKANEEQLKSQRSQISQKDIENGRPLSQKKKWQRLIITIVKIIRYLTSLNMQWSQNEQIVRKLIIELQYWFLICPSNKTRNYIILQLFNTSTLIDTKIQAIKVSQCTQIGSNIIYGYYDTLDTYGLTIILKMMAGVKTNWQDGKGFQQLDEVCLMSEKLYMQQRLVQNQTAFTKTIQSFVQCANSLLADLQQPHKKQWKRIGKNPQDKFFKMIDYIFSKLKIILQQNVQYILNEWNFLTGFWISFCSNKVIQIRNKTMAHIGEVIPIILKKSQIRQQLILSTYIQLSKLHILEISKLILVHIKSFLLSINSQEAIIQIFRIIKIILEHKKYQTFQEEIFQLQEMLIKQSLFKIKNPKNIVFVIQSMTFLNGDKNWEYKTVNLVWSISDHLKIMSKNNELEEVEFVWRKIFTKIQTLAINSVHGQTKQSCIHTFTQIIAELSHSFGKSLFFSILQDIYLEVFYILLGISQRQKHVQNIAQTQMMKIGIKNTIKILKKCISQDKQKTQHLLKILNQKILFYLKKRQLNISLQYCFELLSYLQFLKSINSSETQKIDVNKDLIVKILQQIQCFHEKFDKPSLMWRKKYQPLFSEIHKYFK